jgi:pre-rRNA-processing protein TSR1
MDIVDSNVFEKNFETKGPSLEEMFDRMEIKVVGRKDEEDKSEGSIDEESEDDDDFDLNKTFQEDPNKISQKHQKYTDLESRAKEDMDFPDEVDTPLEVEARKRFIKYRGIKSIKNCNWDPYENLPIDYSKIWRFQNFQQAQKDSIQ